MRIKPIVARAGSSIGPPLLFGLGFLVVWEAFIRLFKIKEYLLPSPARILADLWHNLPDLAGHGGTTLFEALIGFLIANALAILLAVGVSFAPALARAVMPFAIALKTTPIVAMAPLLLLWFGTGLAPKIAAAALISFFPALVNSIRGLHSLEAGEGDLFKVYGASKLQVLFKVRFPRAAPYIFSALKISSSLCIVGAIIGEFVGANRGIGYVILVSSYHLETVRMFSAMAVAALAGIAFYASISAAEGRIVFWAVEPVEEFKAQSTSISTPR